MIDVQTLVSANQLHKFYTCAEWLSLRAEVLADDHFECQDCKAHGRYTRADTVHHDRFVRKHPELALSRYYTDGSGVKRRNLVSLCHDCHERRHGYRQKKRAKPLTEERWD